MVVRTAEMTFPEFWTRGFIINCIFLKFENGHLKKDRNQNRNFIAD
jgi:hypothetical protein